MRFLRMTMLGLLMASVGMAVGLGQVTPKLLGLFVVPTDYATIGAALAAADEANGGTVVVLDRPEGPYDENIFIAGNERGGRGKLVVRLLGVGATLNGEIKLGCGAEAEIVGFQIQGEISACAQSLLDLIMAVQGLGPDLEKLTGRLALRSNRIDGNVRLVGFFGFNYELELTDNIITGGVSVEIERVVSLKAQLKNNWVLGSTGDGIRLRLNYDSSRSTLQSSAKLEGNVIELHSGHGLVLEFSSDSKQPAPVELVGNIIQLNGGCGIWVNPEGLQLGAQLRGQANSVYLNGEANFCPDPSSSGAASQLFPSQLSSTKVWRVCPQLGPNCDTTSIQEALNKSQRGDVIVVEPGVYSENLRVRGSSIIMGGGATASTEVSSSSARAQASGVVLQGREGPGIIVEDGVVVLEGFTIQGFKERCLERQGDRCVKADPGDGIQLRGRSQAFLRGIQSLQNEGWGLRARSTTGVRLEGVLLSQNRAGGLALAESASARLQGVQIIENSADGMALFGPAVRLQGAPPIPPILVGENKGCGLAAYPFEPALDPLIAGRSPGLGQMAELGGAKILLEANGADLCGNVPKELRSPLAEPKQTSVDLSCSQDWKALQQAIDSLQPGGKLRLRGTCPAGAVIDKPLILEGSGSDNTVIPMLSLLTGAEVQLNSVSVGKLWLAPGAKLVARRAKLAGVWVEGGDLTGEESQLIGPVQLWGLSAPSRLNLRTSQLQGGLELWALRQEIEAELTKTQLTGTGAEVGVWAFGSGGASQSRLLLQLSQISGYKTGILAAGRSIARLEGNTIIGNELGVALALPTCPTASPLPSGRPPIGGELEGLQNQISGNRQDFCPEELGHLLTRSETHPARFSIEELAIQPPPPVVAGTTAAIIATVRNRGDRADTKSVWLEVQDQRQGEQSVTLRPGEQARLSFSYTFAEAGSVTVAVRSPDGGATTTVEVQVLPARLDVCCNLAFRAARGGPNPEPQHFTVSNRGGQTLTWSASANKSWAKLSPDRGALKPGESAEVTVAVEISGLPEGNQGAQITVSSPEAANSPLTLFVGVQITAIPLNDWRIVLSWGANPEDLDSHLWTPDGEHIWYGNTVGENADLDVDDTDGYGPETITIRKLVEGTYVYAVKHFSGEGTLQGAQVEIFNPMGSVRRFTNSPCSAGEGSWWVVFKLRVRGTSVEVETVNRCLSSFNEESTTPPDH